MKKGVIVYITGNEPEILPDEPRNMISGLKIPADKVEYISSRSGYHDIHSAAWKLMVSGMQHIVCMGAEFTDDSGIRLTGKELRFYG